MYPPNLNTIADPATRNRIAIERKIVLALIDQGLKEGYELSVDDGEERSPWTRDRQAVIDAIMETDEDRLLYRKDNKVGAVFLVYGNDGWDVICDHSVSLSDHLAPVFKLCERLERA